MIRTGVHTAVVFALMSAAPVYAQPTQPAAQPPEFLVLGFARDGQLVPEVRAAVASRIKEQPLWRVQHPEMSQTDLRCTWENCLKLAEAYGKADHLVWGTITTKDGPSCPGTNQPKDMTISVTAIAIIRDGNPNLSPDKKKKIEFSSCSDQEVAVKVADLVETMLIGNKPTDGGSRQGGFIPPLPCPENMSRFRTGVLQGAFAGAAVSGLIAGASLHYVSARSDLTATMVPSQKQSPIDWHLDPYQRAAWTIMSVGIAGSALGTLGLRSKGDGNDYCVTNNRLRWTYGRGWAVGMFSSLILATAITKWTFTTQTKSACVRNEFDSSCDFGAQIGLGWAFSVPWTVGLGLSLGL